MSDANSFAEYLLSLSVEAPSFDVFVHQSLERLRDDVGGDVVAMIIAEEGHWIRFQAASRMSEVPSLPSIVLSRVADEGVAHAEDDWQVWPLPDVPPRPALLARYRGTNRIPAEVLHAFSQGVIAAHRRYEVRRNAALERALRVGWQRWRSRPSEDRDEVADLLHQLAQAVGAVWQATDAMFFLGHPGAAPVAISSQSQANPIWRDGLLWIEEMMVDGKRRLWQRPGDPSRLTPTTTPLATFESLLAVPLYGAPAGRKPKDWAAMILVDRAGGFRTLHAREVATWAKEIAELVARLAPAVTQVHPSKPRGLKGGLVGSSKQMDKVREAISRVAPADLTVLVLGENGSGKEVVSRLIHQQSGREDKPFLAINCAAVSESLLVSELFGHEKGAFTDAHEAKPGKFELAAGGTLFLDEIGELPSTCQAQLLRALEERVIVRLGGSTPITIDARIIAATHRELPTMVRRGEFREDLFYRLNVVQLELPPLRDRVEDVAELANYFLEAFCRKAGRPTPQLAPASLAQLEAYAWPGNVRELRNMMERVVYLVAGETIEPQDLPPLSSPTGEETRLPLSEATREFQKSYIDRQIRLAAGNMTQAAERLGMHRSNLYRKMNQLEMNQGKEAD